MAYVTAFPPGDRFLWETFDNSPDGVLTEHNGAIVYINDTYATLLGYHRAEDLSGATFREIADPSDIDRLAWFTMCRNEGRPAPQRYLFTAKRRDRSTITFDASVSTARAPQGSYITTFVREVIDGHDTQRDPMSVPGLKALSPREQYVFFALLAGRRAKEIALDLAISEKTVATHRARVYYKLALRSDLDLFRFAARHGVLDLTDGAYAADDRLRGTTPRAEN
jgi:PAS domain S-box-containing protein